MRTTAALLCVSAVLVGLPGGGEPAGAAFPGRNGLIAFQSFRDGHAQIYVMSDAPTQPKRVRQANACHALPAWDRNGRRIAFELNPSKAGRPASRSEIYLMNRDGRGVINLTNRPGFDGDPSWSHDGKSVIFESQRNGNTDIYRIEVGTRETTRLTRHPGVDEDPVWSPGGRRIAFTSRRNGNREVYLMNPNGTSVLNITQNRADDFDPTWSPNGEFVAFVSDRDGNLEIYTTNDRFLLRRLTDDPAIDAFPSWSPDGRSIAFVSDRAESRNRDLYVMHSDGSSVRRLTESTAWDVAPDWGSAPLGAIGTLPPLPTPRPPAPAATSALACVQR
jgi:Tol biopolymer transport system component